jgi:hypothetical protein
MSEMEVDDVEREILNEIAPKITDSRLIIIIMSYCAILKEQDKKWEELKQPKKYLLTYLNALNENQILDMAAVDKVDKEFIASVPTEEQDTLSDAIGLTIFLSTISLSNYMS